MCTNLSDSDSTPEILHCSEPQCNSHLDTYALNNGVVIGTCRSDGCRLFGVTLDVEDLALLTEQQRAEWGASNQKRRDARDEWERKHAEMLYRIPSHIRTIG